MSKKREVKLDDDNNRRDRDNKWDRKEVRQLHVNEQRRGDLKGGGKTQAARTKQSSGK